MLPARPRAVAQGSGRCGDIIDMSDFGTGLRAHLEGTRGVVAPDPPAPGARPNLEAVTAVLEAERCRLESLAAQLAGKELELGQREAELHAKQEQMAVNLAQALIQAAHTTARPELPA